MKNAASAIASYKKIFGQLIENVSDPEIQKRPQFGYEGSELTASWRRRTYINHDRQSDRSR